MMTPNMIAAMVANPKWCLAQVGTMRVNFCPAGQPGRNVFFTLAAINIHKLSLNQVCQYVHTGKPGKIVRIS
jgi:hypothetical protein